jgi:hypothetical protein
MHAFSSADLISPAIKRTKWFLFEPFRWGTFLKLCAVSVLTEGWSTGSSNFRIPGGHHGTVASPPPASIPTVSSPYFGLSPMQVVLIAAVVMCCIGIALVIFYLVTRLRFALFHCLVYQTREIRPGWQLYDRPSWRFFLLSIAVGLIFFFAVLLIALPFILGFYHQIQGAHSGGSINIATFLSMVLPLIPVFILIVLAALAVHIILHDLMLPHMALENASSSTAWRQVRSHLAAEKGGFLLYGFFRVILPLAARIAAAIVIAIPVILVIAIFGLPTAGLIALAVNATALGKFLLILLIAIGVLVLFAVGVFVVLCVGGPIGIATRNFALLFYGGRYAVLGDLLAPPSPPPASQGAATPA